jgi:hypothetical protein
MLVVLAVVAGVVFVQFFARKPPSRITPGPARGDLGLTQDALPAVIHGWQQTGFVPASPPEKLPPGQYWWVHRWDYRTQEIGAVVCLDQLGDDQWHELTLCYQNLGWTITQRTVQNEIENGSLYVIAGMKDESGSFGLLVFSVFYEDGQWATPPGVNLGLLNSGFRGGNALERRFGDGTRELFFGGDEPGHSRAIQCQVLVTNSKEFPQSQIESAVQLHLASRQVFRDRWVQHSSREPDLVDPASSK